MRWLLSFALLLSLLASAEGSRPTGRIGPTPRVVVVNETHVFHRPIPMNHVIGALGIQGLGGLGLDLGVQGQLGGFLDYQDGRLRMAISGALGLDQSEVCYQGAADWLGYVLAAERTYRIRLGGGGGLGLCYPLSGGKPRVQPILEALANLQFQVIPNVIADVSFSAGYPNGLLGAVGFALAF